MKTFLLIALSSVGLLAQAQDPAAGGDGGKSPKGAQEAAEQSPAEQAQINAELEQIAAEQGQTLAEQARVLAEQARINAGQEQAPESPAEGQEEPEAPAFDPLSGELDLAWQEAEIQFRLGTIIPMTADDTPPMVVYSCFAVESISRHVLETLGARNVNVECEPWEGELRPEELFGAMMAMMATLGTMEQDVPPPGDPSGELGQDGFFQPGQGQTPEEQGGFFQPGPPGGGPPGGGPPFEALMKGFIELPPFLGVGAEFEVAGEPEDGDDLVSTKLTTVTLSSGSDCLIVKHLFGTLKEAFPWWRHEQVICEDGGVDSPLSIKAALFRP